MSVYDSAVVNSVMLEDPRMQAVEDRGARHLFTEMLVWSKANRLDGFVPRRALRRCTDDENPDASVAKLVGAGLVDEVGGGYQIADYVTHQWTRDRVEQKIKTSRESSRRHDVKIAADRRGKGSDASDDTSGDTSSDGPIPTDRLTDRKGKERNVGRSRSRDSSSSDAGASSSSSRSLPNSVYCGPLVKTGGRVCERCSHKHARAEFSGRGHVCKGCSKAKRAESDRWCKQKDCGELATEKHERTPLCAVHAAESREQWAQRTGGAS